MMSISENSREAERQTGPGEGPTPPGAAYREGPWRQGYPAQSRYKSALLATILSVMPGLGQVYVGYYQQGFINILVVASLISLLATDRTPEAILPLLGIFLAFYWMYNLVDANRRASYYNRALDGAGPEQLPEDIALPDARGSLLGGIVLLVLGLVFLLHTRFGMSLDWVEEWWPVAPLAVGVYLVYKHFRSQ